jgi:hypothetical protein
MVFMRLLLVSVRASASASYIAYPLVAMFDEDARRVR